MIVVKSWKRQQMHTMALAIASGMFLVVAGNGCAKKIPVLPVYKVSGQVLVNNEPAIGAMVILNPVAGALPQNIVPSATTNKEGKFKINGYGTGDGAPAGEYVVTVSWFKLIDAPSGLVPGPNVIPAQYSNPKTSPVKVEVQKGKATEIPTIEIQ